MYRLSKLYILYMWMISLFIFGFIGMLTNEWLKIIGVWMVLIGAFSTLFPNFFYQALEEMSIKNTGGIDPNLTYFKTLFKYVGVIGGLILIFIGIFAIIHGHLPL